ncbi:hypothetical protein [Bradyrhizobium sp. USDA 4486]
MAAANSENQKRSVGALGFRHVFQPIFVFAEVPRNLGHGGDWWTSMAWVVVALERRSVMLASNSRRCDGLEPSADPLSAEFDRLRFGVGGIAADVLDRVCKKIEIALKMVPSSKGWPAAFNGQLAPQRRRDVTTRAKSDRFESEGIPMAVKF